MAKHFKELLESAGIRRHDQVVLYEDAMDNGYGQSCRGRFMLNYFGHENVRALHGGYRAWRAKGLPLTDEKTRVERSVYDVQINSAEMLTSDDILEAIGDPSIILLDCRDYAEWIGVTSSPYAIDFSPRKGRIPGAVWIEWYRMMYRKGGIPWIKSKQEILEVCEQVGINTDTKVYIYCFKGARASNMLTALKIAGVKDVRNYLGSWHDRALNPDLPIDEDYPEY
jgi:thiosulfate/3-mercaptopyruvate sulfurtransferase